MCDIYQPIYITSMGFFQYIATVVKTAKLKSHKYCFWQIFGLPIIPLMQYNSVTLIITWDLGYAIFFNDSDNMNKGWAPGKFNHYIS